jgi:hypothetical protein
MGLSLARAAAKGLLASAIVVAALAACSEKPQRVYAEDGQDAYNLETGNALAERARNQGESERIGN